MTYNHFEHRHRFAVWAGARAAQRGFATVEYLRDALESTDIRQFVADNQAIDISAADFEVRHRNWCNSIAEHLSERGVANATFGRAAKLVAVYLKSMIVVGPHTTSALAEIVHPPIDRILLQNLGTSAEIQSVHKKGWLLVNWTMLDEPAYYTLLSQLRTVLAPSDPWWLLERHWTVTNNPSA
jgi:hypothetical protein